MNLTRRAALSAAGFVYASLAERARSLSSDPDYVDAVYQGWRDRLETLNSFRTDPVLGDETNRAVAGLLAAAASTPDRDADALIRWLDAFPDAMTDLFPPSDSTFDVQLDDADLNEVLAEDPVEAGEFALVA